MTAGETYLSPAELVDRWGGRVKVKTLGNWRTSGEGPAYQKFGNRIGYPMSAIIDYERKGRFNSTADYGKKDPA
jgi:hypothetical protein